MIAQIRRAGNTTQLIASAAIAAAGTLAAVAVTKFAGTKTGLMLAFAAIFGPVLVYVAAVAPIVFPFGLYAAAVPFSNLLNLPQFGTLSKILGAASGLALLVYILRTRRASPPTAALFIWTALAVWMAATAFWAIDQPSVLALLPTPVQLLILYGAISIFPSDRTAVRWAVLATIAGGVAASAYGAYLFHSGTDIFGEGNRLWIVTDTSEIDPNHFAAALVLPVAFCAAIALRASKTIVIATALAALGILLVGIVESGSRGAALGVAIMAIYLFIRGGRPMRLAAFALPAAAVVAVLSAHTSIWTRFAQSISTGGSNRLPIWHIGLTALKSHWLLGAGYNNFTFAYDRAFLLTNQVQFADWHRAPHDLLIGTAVELGVVGLGLLLAGWIAQFRMLRNVSPEDPDYLYRLALEAALIGTFILAIFLDVMITKYVWLIFMLCALVHNAHPKKQHA